MATNVWTGKPSGYGSVGGPGSRGGGTPTLDQDALDRFLKSLGPPVDPAMRGMNTGRVQAAAAAPSAMLDPSQKLRRDENAIRAAAGGASMLPDPGQRAAFGASGGGVTPGGDAGGFGLPPNNEFFRMLADMDSDADRAQKGFGMGLIDQGVLDALLAQDTMNINDETAFQWNQGVGPAGNQIGLIGGGGGGDTTALTPAELCANAGGAWNGVSCDMGGTTLTPAEQCANAGGTWNGVSCDMGGGGGDDPCPPGQVRNAAGQCVVPAGGTGGEGGGGDVPAGIQETAADAISIVQDTLSKQNKAIQNALQAGLLDIDEAAKIWDTQREQIYKDFISQYGGVTDQYATEEERLTAERKAERDRILADLNARGVDASMVGDELGILDALVASQSNANVGYMDNVRDIAGMADVDRKWLGEGIFGGYKQDLESQMRDVGLGLEIDSATAEGERLDQALSSNALAAYLGVPAGTLMGGMVGGVDIPGMAFQTSERKGAEDFAKTQAELDRKAQGIDPLTGRPYGFSTETGLTAGQQATFNAQGIDPVTGLPYGFDTATGLTAGQTQEQDNWFDTMVAAGYDMSEGGTGRAIGFDPLTGLTAGQTQEQSNWMANMIAAGYDMSEGGTGQAIGFDPVTGLTAGQTTEQDNWLASMIAQGYDMSEGGTGLPIGFDPATGLTAAEGLTQANLENALDITQMGVDTKKWAHDAEGQLIPNPTYGMSPTEQADYAMDLWTMTQTDPEETTATGRLMNYLSQLGDPAFTASVLTNIHEIINNSISLSSKGMSESNVLYALGALANTPSEDGKTYPYRDMFQIVQQGSGATGAGGGTTGAGGFVHPGAVGVEDENLTAVADAAAAAGGGGATFIPGGGEFGYDTVVAPVPAGTQPHNASQREYHYETGTPIAFYLNDGRPIYQDSEGMYLMYSKGGETERFYKGDGWRWPADQEWPPPIVQVP